MRKRYFFFPKNWHRCGLLTGLVLLFSFNLQAQNGPAKQWDKTIGGSTHDYLMSLQKTSDGGYILGGFSYSGISGDKSQACQGIRDYWVVKLDATGSKTWDKTFGGSGDDYFTSLQQTSDGGYILGGNSDSGISGDKTQATKGLSDYWVVKLDASGNKLWDKTFGGNSGDYLHSLQQTSDGGYILGGQSQSAISGDKSQASKGTYDYWVVKLDASGNKTWDKTIGGSSSDILYSLQQTSNGGYILGGYSNSPISGDKTQVNKGDVDYWVVMVDASGNTTWDKTFGGNGTDYLFSLQKTSNGGYILGGESASGISGDKSQTSQGVFDFWVIKLDANGNKTWDKTFGGSGDDELSSLQQTSDGGYILGGYSASGISGDKSQASKGYRDYWIVKLDTSGNKTWDKTIGDTGDDELTSLQQTSDGGYILGGWSDSGIGSDKTQASKGSFDYWVVKLGPNCADLTATLTTSCGSSSSNINVNIAGLQSTTTGTPSWTLNYTVNGINQTATGATPDFTLQLNAVPGTVYSLVSIVSGSCTTNLTNSLTIPPAIAQPAITLFSPDTLMSSVTGSSYEWKFNSTTLPNTKRKLKATASGTYSMRVIDANNCTSAFSPDYNYTVTGIKDDLKAGIDLYPNPSTGIVSLVLKGQPTVQVTVFNSLGQFIFSKTVSKNDQKEAVQLNLSNVAKGVYLLKVSSEGATTVRKLIVE